VKTAGTLNKNVSTLLSPKTQMIKILAAAPIKSCYQERAKSFNSSPCLPKSDWWLVRNRRHQHINGADGAGVTNRAPLFCLRRDRTKCFQQLRFSYRP